MLLFSSGQFRHLVLAGLELVAYTICDGCCGGGENCDDRRRVDCEKHRPHCRQGYPDCCVDEDDDDDE